MSTLTLKRLGMLLAALVVGWGVLSLLRGGLGERLEELDVAGVTNVTGIAMAGPSDTVALALGDDERWTVNGYEPAAEAVHEVLTLLAAGVTGELAARSVTSHERLGVDSLAGRRVAVRRGDDTVLDLWLGRPGRAMHTSYLRLAGDSAVYHYQGRLAPLLTQSLELWRERMIARVPADTVATLDVTRPRGGYVLSRADGWRLRGAVTDSSQVARLLSEFGNLRARGFPTREEEAAAAFRAGRQVTLLDVAGDTLLALQLDSTDAGWFVRRRAGGTVWRLDGWLAERLMPPDSMLLRRDP